MNELREMGVQRHWLRIAEEIGVDEFLKVWRILDQELGDIDSSQKGRIFISLRKYSTYLRYQRNRYIESLSSEGHPPRIIRKILMTTIHEKISIRHIWTVLQKCKNEAPERLNP